VSGPRNRSHLRPQQMSLIVWLSLTVGLACGRTGNGDDENLALHLCWVDAMHTLPRAGHHHRRRRGAPLGLSAASTTRFKLRRRPAATACAVGALVVGAAVALGLGATADSVQFRFIHRFDARRVPPKRARFGL
jgi:hypothetical protein